MNGKVDDFGNLADLGFAKICECVGLTSFVPLLRIFIPSKNERKCCLTPSALMNSRESTGFFTFLLREKVNELAVYDA
jgi:hypothetical protein